MKDQPSAMASAPEPAEEPSLSVMRTLVRHERGTMLLLMVLLGIVIIAQSAYLYHLLRHEQIYSCPDIYREQGVKILWGRHG